MSRRLPVDLLFEAVVDTGLCTRCGTCVGVCPSGNLSIPDPMGSCLPARADQCTRCGLCLEGCPGARVDIAALEGRLFGGAASHPLLGVVRTAHLAHARDEALRGRGSSGGVVTALLLDMLRRGEIAGALLFAPLADEPWRAWGSIASDEERIVGAAQSRYHLSPLNAALGELPRGETPYAYVGLPCQIHGLRKLQASGWKAPSPLDPVIGLYCGNNLYYDATRAVLRKLGIARLEEIASLRYREGPWPGSFSAETRTGLRRSATKLDFNQVIPFYVNRRCLFCTDLAAELSDLSVGDGWAKEGAGEKGWSVLLARSPRGEAIVGRARDGGTVALEDIGVEDATSMHALAFDLKKRGAPLRLVLWKRWGFAVPSYDRIPERPPAGRRIAEAFISIQFLAAGSFAGRFLFRFMPFRPTGAFFRRLRKQWMNGSRPR